MAPWDLSEALEDGVFAAVNHRPFCTPDLIASEFLEVDTIASISTLQLCTHTYTTKLGKSETTTVVVAPGMGITIQVIVLGKLLRLWRECPSPQAQLVRRKFRRFGW